MYRMLGYFCLVLNPESDVAPREEVCFSYGIFKHKIRVLGRKMQPGHTEHLKYDGIETCAFITSKKNCKSGRAEL